MMNKFLIYGLAGGASLLVLAAVVKRKPSRMSKQLDTLRTYYPVKGDRAIPIMQRFGDNSGDITPWNAVNPSNPTLRTSPGNTIKIIAGKVDNGPRPGAMGTVK